MPVTDKNFMLGSIAEQIMECSLDNSMITQYTQKQLMIAAMNSKDTTTSVDDGLFNNTFNFSDGSILVFTIAKIEEGTV